jgi:hypothetical protein
MNKYQIDSMQKGYENPFVYRAYFDEGEHTDLVMRMGWADSLSELLNQDWAWRNGFPRAWLQLRKLEVLGDDVTFPLLQMVAQFRWWLDGAGDERVLGMEAKLEEMQKRR